MMRGRALPATSCSMSWDSGPPARFSRSRQFWLISSYFEPGVETGLRSRGRFSEPRHKLTLSRSRSSAGGFRTDLHSWRMWSRSWSLPWHSLSSCASPRSRQRCGHSQLPLPPKRTFRSDFRSVCPLRATLADSPVMTSSRHGRRRAPGLLRSRSAKYSEGGDHSNAPHLDTAGCARLPMRRSGK